MVSPTTASRTTTSWPATPPSCAPAGIQTTTFGVGADFDEALLQAMANAGGGNFYYIADARQITDYITSEVGEALDVVARDVVLEVVTPRAWRSNRSSPFPF